MIPTKGSGGIDRVIAFCLVLAGISISTQAHAQKLTLEPFAAGDVAAPIASTEKDRRPFQVTVRSVELAFLASVDHIFDGMLNIAGHTEGGEFKYDLHEAFLSTSKLIPRSRLRGGKFFFGVGRLNQIHQHDWPFTDAPKAHAQFFAEEGAADTGLEYAYLLPTERFIEVTLGVATGACYGHCHKQGPKPSRPLFYVRPATFFGDSASGAQLGVSYLNRLSPERLQTQLGGFDLTYKMREGKSLVWLSQSELYFQIQSKAGTKTRRHLGGYTYLQRALAEQWSLGLRFDGFSELSRAFQTTGGRQADLDYALVPSVAWKPSEFSTVRLSYERFADTTQGERDLISHSAQLQWVFILGAHPAHDF